MLRSLGLVGVVSILCAGSTAAQRGGSDVRAAIEAASKQFVAAFAKGDAAQLASMYTADAQAFPPNSDIVRGRDAIRKLWQGVLDAGIKSAPLTTLEVEAHGDTAHEVGTYAMRVEGGKQVDHGKYIVIWKREQGQWRLHRDIWNSSAPATR
jgi:uncharacterized protein (TIGR02246 family)